MALPLQRRGLHGPGVADCGVLSADAGERAGSSGARPAPRVTLEADGTLTTLFAGKVEYYFARDREQEWGGDTGATGH